MRIATWNVNSARSRVERMTAFLERQSIDVLAVQETKCTDANFPTRAFTEMGYEVAHCGYNQWNGVAIISRVGIEGVAKEFPHQPGFHKDPSAPQKVEARALGARCGGVQIWSLYVPNGRAITDRHYDYKIRWLWALHRYVQRVLADTAEEKLLLVGDFNIAPRDDDVWDMAAFEGRTHVTEPERQMFAQLLEDGLVSTGAPGYTYFDYQQGRFQRGEGMRIDFQLASPALARAVRGSTLDIAERSGKGASDHLPVIVEYEA